MSLRTVMGLYQFGWMIVSNYQQHLAWKDAAQARIGRDRAEAEAATQTRQMLSANPSGALGHAKLNDGDALRRAGLL